MQAGSRPRVPGVAYTALSVLFIVFVAAISLTVRQAPPTIAEYAPQAVENITDSPDEQSSRSGRPGGVGPGALATAVSASGNPDVPAPIDVPRVRRCVGDPPRQIEDAQSPPCVPYWKGDNGGATYKGVNRDEIRLAVTDWGQTLGNGQTMGELAVKLQAFFNRRFEFYGRRLNLLDNGEGAGDAPAEQRGSAVRADEVLKVFGSLAEQSIKWFYYDELARRKIVSTTDWPGYTESALASRDPYLWSYPMSYDKISRTIGRWVCDRLAGKGAVHAQGAEQGAPRRFGVLLQYESVDQQLDTNAVAQQLAGCGVKPAYVYRHADDEGDASSDAVVVQMRRAGVTSVICLCHVLGSSSFFNSATSQGYFPEWLISTFNTTDSDFWAKSIVPVQWRNAFGLRMMPKEIRPDRDPSVWAVREADPSFVPPSDGLTMFWLAREYKSLLLLASGIQMAGPNLTPATFAAGLHKTLFPNPEDPDFAGKVGFSDGDHSMTEDAAEIWWDTSARGPYSDTQGAYCYVDGGARRSREWPSGDPFFKPPCDTGA